MEEYSTESQVTTAFLQGVFEKYDLKKKYIFNFNKMYG